MAEKAQSQVGPFDERDSHRTLALLVEGRKLWVPREVLASYSPVFKTMLYGAFAEANKDAIELPEKKAEDIEELLLCLIPTPEVKKIDHENLELAMAFSDEYNIKDLRQRAVAALSTMTKEMGDCDKGLLRLLCIASKYGMKEELPELVKRCGMEFDFAELKSVFKYSHNDVIAGLLLYRAGMPLRSNCRYEHISSAMCDVHYIAAILKCVYCGDVRCFRCLAEKTIMCEPRGIEEMDQTVRGWLNRL